MKIALLEDIMLAFGGRQIQFADAFLSFFKEQGHDVKMYSRRRFKRNLLSPNQLKDYLLSKNLSRSDFIFKEPKLPWTKSFYRELGRYDLLLTCAAYTHVVDNVNRIPVIHWIIAKPNDIMLRRFQNPRSILWTDSYTNRRETGLKNASVIYPPYDFSTFRKNARAWDDREIDVLLVTAITKQKLRPVFLRPQLKYIDSVTKKMKLKTVGVFLVRTQKEAELVKGLSFETHMNLTRREVSKFYGNAKIFFHPSPIECSAIVVFEALNSGCYPVVRRAGACMEQMGRVGIIYDNINHLNRGFWNWINDDILNTDYNVKWSIRQGEKFDRKRVGAKITKLLRGIEKR